MYHVSVILKSLSHFCLFPLVGTCLMGPSPLFCNKDAPKSPSVRSIPWLAVPSGFFIHQKNILCEPCLTSSCIQLKHFIIYSILFVTYFYVHVSPCISTFVLMFSTMLWASLVAQMVKNLPAVQETQVQSLGQEDPLKKGMATHWSILAWRISWTEERGGLQFVRFQRVRHDWVTNTFHFNTSYFRHCAVSFHWYEWVYRAKQWKILPFSLSETLA